MFQLLLLNLIFFLVYAFFFWLMMLMIGIVNKSVVLLSFTRLLSRGDLSCFKLLIMVDLFSVGDLSFARGSIGGKQSRGASSSSYCEVFCAGGPVRDYKVL